MNRKLRILVLALALLCLFAGCRENQTDVPEVEVTQPTVDAVEETTLPEEETVKLPEGEGVESIDEVIDGEDNLVEAQDETKPQNTTKPTEAPAQKPTEVPAQKPTEAPAQKPTEAPAAPETTEPVQEQTPATQPEQPAESQPTEPPATEAPTTPPAASTSCCCEYQRYMAMSAAEQEAYMNSFDSPLAFVEWIKQAQAEHEAHDTTIKVEGGDLDIGDYINP